jgi:hypothetical protein
MAETLDQYEEDLAGGADFFKFKDGDNEVRLCPPAPGEKKPFAKRGQHWRIGDAEKTFNCPKALNEDAQCFLCDKQLELKKSDDDADVDKATDMYAKRQFLYRIIDPSSEASLRKGIQVMGIGIKAHKQIAKLMRDKEYGDLTDPVHGINITIEKSGSGQYGTEYAVRPRRNESNVVDILEANEPPDIFGICEPATNKQMKAAWNNVVSDDDKPKPEAEKSRRKSVDDDEPKPRRSRDEDPEDPEPEAPRRNRDDDEPKPRRARDDDEPTPKRSAAKDEDDPPRGRRLATRSRDED